MDLWYHRWTLRFVSGLLVILGATAIVGLLWAKDRPKPPELVLIIRGADPSLAKETEKVLREAHREMASASGVSMTDTVRVVYVSRQQSFDSIAGGFFPDWGSGVAIADKKLIAIRSPREYAIGDQLFPILRHELAHLHFETILGWRRPPRWMNEGYAQQFAHEWNYGDDWTIARAVFSGSALPLSDIDGVNSFRDAKAKLAYSESYLAMGYFLDTYGWDGLMLIARTMRQGGHWDDAFTQATGADYASFQNEFMAYLDERYNWASFLGDTALLWIVLVMLFLILYLIKRRRAGLKLSAWGREEAVEDILYAPFERPPDRPAQSDHDT